MIWRTSCFLSLVFFATSMSCLAQQVTPESGFWPWMRDCSLPQLPDLGPRTDSNFTVLGRWSWGPCQAVDVRGEYAYISNGVTFQVLDVSHPQTPTIVGEYVADWLINDIRLHDTLAFVATEATVLILNISDPQHPTRVGELFNSSGSLRVAPVDSFAYVTTVSGTLRIVDVSDPRAPHFRGVIGVGGEYPWCLTTQGRHAYVGNIDLPNLAIIDATNPDVLRATSFNINGFGFAGAVCDTFLYLGVRPQARFQVYSISNPDSPVFISQIHMPFVGVEALTVHGTTAYVSSKDSGVVALDIADPQHPQIRGQHRAPVKSPGGIYTALAATGTDLFVNYYNGLGTLNTANVDSLWQVSFFPTGGTAEKIFLEGNLAFVASGYSGLWVLDMTNPQRPKPLSNILTGDGYASDVVVADSCAYVVCAYFSEVDTARGLWILNIANPMRPRLMSRHAGITRYSNVIEFNRLALQDHLLLITQPDDPTNDTTVETLDVSDPYRPTRLSIFRGQYFLFDIAVRDSFAYMARVDSGLKVVDFRNPLAPVPIGNALGNEARGVTLKDNLVFVDRADTLFVIDASNPSSPRVVGRARGYPFTSYARDLAVSDNYLYSVEGNLVGFDISNPTSPRMRAIFQKRYRRGGVDASDHNVFVADGQYGVWAIENDLITTFERSSLSPTAFTLCQNYPNPFNSSTKIRFQIPTTSYVKLQVYDVLGREVSTLVSEELPYGSYEKTWHAFGVGSGVYFCRLQAGNLRQIMKMLIIK